MERTRRRTFVLVRYEDVTGVTGTGDIAEGAQFDNGAVVLGGNRSRSVPRGRPSQCGPTWPA